MARRKASEPLQKVTINFYRSSYEAMAAIYPDVGPQAAIRALVHQHVAKVRAARQALSSASKAEEIVDLSLESDYE